LLDAPPLRLAWLRFLVGGGVIALWAWATGRLAGFRIERHEWRPLLVLGALFTAQIGTMNVATSLTNAAHGSILLNLHAVHTVVLAHFLIPGDRLSLRRFAGILLAYAGILVLFTGGASDRTASLLGDAIMFVSAAILAERTVYLAGAVQRFDPAKLLLAHAATGIAGERLAPREVGHDVLGRGLSLVAVGRGHPEPEIRGVGQGQERAVAPPPRWGQPAACTRKGWQR